MITGDKEGIILAICIHLLVLTPIILFKMGPILIIWGLYHILYFVISTIEGFDKGFKLDHFKNLILIPLPTKIKWEINSKMEITQKEKKFRWLPLSIRWYGVCLNSGYFANEIDKILIQRDLCVFNDGIVEISYSTYDDDFNTITQKELSNKFKVFLIDVVNALKSKGQK